MNGRILVGPEGVHKTIPVTTGDSSTAVATTRAWSTSRGPVLDPPLVQLCTPQLVAGEPDQVGVVEPLADRGGLGRRVVASLPVPWRSSAPARPGSAASPIPGSPAARVPGAAALGRTIRGTDHAPEQQVVLDPEDTATGGQRVNRAHVHARS
jgi:hypothetical protein